MQIEIERRSDKQYTEEGWTDLILHTNRRD